MTEAYRAIYDAANLNLSGLSSVSPHLLQEIYSVSHALQAPHVLMRARVYPDGDQWCALYGDDIQNGVCGFGPTPERACADFDVRWFKGHQTAEAGTNG